ncbi:MAG: DUF296 domain-containing protein [Pseudomonadota bacterium]
MAKAGGHHMVHPGPVHPDRIVWARGALRHVEGKKPAPGTSLRDAVATLVAQTGQTSGTGRFVGSFSRFRFTTGGPARDGRAANYTFIRDVNEQSGPVDVRFTVGLNSDGECHVHAHGQFLTVLPDGEEGGHLFPEDCIIEDFDRLNISLVDGLLLRQNQDLETLHSVFDIEAGGTTGDGLFVRVRPNEDMVDALSHLLLERDAQAARSINSIGSLNEPVFVSADGVERPANSIGMEIISMDVTWDRQAEDCIIACSAVDEAGHVHKGKLVPGLAPVCVTGEILLAVTD